MSGVPTTRSLVTKSTLRVNSQGRRWRRTPAGVGAADRARRLRAGPGGLTRSSFGVPTAAPPQSLNPERQGAQCGGWTRLDQGQAPAM
jgi:hypothetical protein